MGSPVLCEAGLPLFDPVMRNRGRRPCQGTGLFQPDVFQADGPGRVELEVHDVFLRRPDDGRMRYRNDGAFVIDQLQGLFVNFGSLGLVYGLFSLKHQVVVFFVVPLRSNG